MAGRSAAVHGSLGRSEPGQAVDAGRVLRRPGTRRARPRPSSRPSRRSSSRRCLEGHPWHCVPARARHPLDVDHDHRPRAGYSGKPASEPAASAGPAGGTVPRPCSRTMSGRPVNAQNINVMRPLSRRWAMVSTPLPGEVEVRDGVSVEHAERVEPLGRAVHETVGIVGRSRDEEHRLRLEERRELALMPSSDRVPSVSGLLRPMSPHAAVGVDGAAWRGSWSAPADRTPRG